jgi:hypothetical protein
VRQAEQTLMAWSSGTSRRSPSAPTCKEVGEACAAGEFDMLEASTSPSSSRPRWLKYAKVPVVAAVQGMALGGGCEFVMHAAKRVMALESYIGLVEAGVGLIPAGGGCKEFAIRAAQSGGQDDGGERSLRIPAAGVHDHRHGQGLEERAQAKELASPSRRHRSSSTPTSCSTSRSAKRGRWPKPAMRPPPRRAA